MKVFKYIGLLASLVLLAIIASGVTQFDVRIPQATIQHAIDAKLPFKRQVSITHWTIDKTNVAVLPKGIFNVTASLDGEFKAHHRIVDLEGNLNLSYRDKAFWVSNIKTDTFKISRIEKIDSPETPDVKWNNKFQKFKTETLTLKKGKLQNILDGGEEYLKAQSVKMLNVFLTYEPVYRLDQSSNWKMKTGALILVSVTTDGQDIIATLDPFGFVLKIILMIILSVIFGAILLFGFRNANP